MILNVTGILERPSFKSTIRDERKSTYMHQLIVFLLAIRVLSIIVIAYGVAVTF